MGIRQPRPEAVDAIVCGGPPVRKAGITSKQFTFYNPLLQNEGHANALVNLGIVGLWQLRPWCSLKTADKFLPFDEHEKIASQNRTWRMRGVICMRLADLHRYIAFSVDAPSNPGLTRQRMETIYAKIQAAAIPVTAESHARLSLSGLQKRRYLDEPKHNPNCAAPTPRGTPPRAFPDLGHARITSGPGVKGSSRAKS